MFRMLRKILFYFVGAVIFTLLFYRFHAPCDEYMSRGANMVPRQTVVQGSDMKQYVYDRDMPLIFVGGVPRSGTTLFRAMLDAHPEVRCGEETRVIPRLLQMRYNWLKSQKESMRLEEAGLTSQVLDSAMSAFILEVIAKHGEPAPRLCNKDPFTLKAAVYLGKLFPNAKFILMVRDGRAVVHSIITRKVTISGFDLSSYQQCLGKWNTIMSVMHQQCKELGSSRCLHVYYEQLVMHPKQWMEKVMQFLDIPWNDSVLHHEAHINKPGGVSLSKVERSTDQVIKPVNLEALSKWVGAIPSDLVMHMSETAPMLGVLGYDPQANPPNYGSPDSFVADNTKEVALNNKWWRTRAQQVLQASKKRLIGSASGGPPAAASAALPSNGLDKDEDSAADK